LDAQHDLIKAAQQGSTRAFEQLIDGLERQMMALAAGLAAFPDEADDIYQEALLNAFRALPKFRLESQFSTWLYSIFVNTAFSYKRRLSQKFSRRAPSDEQHSEPVEHYASPQREVENSRLSLAITKALAQLSEKERIAFVLCHQQELAIFEAAEIMACSEGSVKSYLFRGREKLRRALKAYEIR
jgi:RNA polymerase sigma-70 factor (ECF subfamily)